MKTFALIFISVLIFASCNNQSKNNETTFLKKDSGSISLTNLVPDSTNKNDTSIKIEYPTELSLIKTLNPIWINYYKSKIINFNIKKFKLIRQWKEKNLLTGGILGDFDSNFNKNHSQFLINSPDKSSYIDLDYSEISIVKNRKGQLIRIGGDVDQEINWVNRKNKDIKRISYCGSISEVEDAKWIDGSKVVLYGTEENRLTIEIINLSSLEYKYFRYPDTVSGKLMYTREVRLKKVKFE